jgi:DNA-directed RNA polymerase subunit RPC12/RpoP
MERSLVTRTDAFQNEVEMYATWSEQEALEGRPFQLSIDPPTLPGLRCPACGSDLNRSHARWWERLYKIYTTKRPYRCSRCPRRAWFDVPSQSAPGQEIEMRPSTAFQRARSSALTRWNALTKSISEASFRRRGSALLRLITDRGRVRGIVRAPQMEPNDLERIAKVALRELGAGNPPLTITPAENERDCWRVLVGGHDGMTLKIRAGAGTTANYVREQIFAQFSGR